jgi:hypothetical protein
MCNIDSSGSEEGRVTIFYEQDNAHELTVEFCELHMHRHII